MTVLEVIQRSTEFLARKGVESPRLHVELLLAHVLKMPRLQLYLNFERTLTAQELETLRALVKRRGEREPLQHILGSISFCGLEIFVNRHVLVPRPETEILAEAGWRFLSGLPAIPAWPPLALDFGTGSGCIAVALAANAPASRVQALDISEAALLVARENAERHGLTERIEFVCAADFTGLASDLRFDLIISNPPYIPSAEIDALAPEVRDFDPRLALDGGEDGLRFYRQIAVEAAERLKPGGRVMLEFGDGQAALVERIFVETGWLIEAIEKDLTGRLRILIARRQEA